MSQTLCLPAFPIEPLKPMRSGLRWLVRSGEGVRAREPIAYCNFDFGAAVPGRAARAFPDDWRDLQLVLAPREAGLLLFKPGFSNRGAWLELHGNSFAWESGAAVAELINEQRGESELLYYFVAGRRGLESGEGRSGLLTGWHDRVRAFWPGPVDAPRRTLLAIGNCEQLPIIRGDREAFADWFAGSPGPAQIVLHTDDRLVHSGALLLQHLRRTPAEARALMLATQHELSAIAGSAADESFDAFLPEAKSGTPSRRNLLAQDLAFMQHLVAESTTASPLLERLDLFGANGLVQSPPAELILLSLGSEYAPHFRHRKTGWLVSMHQFRFNELGPAARTWLREGFELFRRTHAEVEKDFAALAIELRERTGAQLLVLNTMTTASWDRIPNYTWVGETFAQSSPVFLNEANSILERLEQHGLCTVVDLDAVAAELGARHAPDRTHASGPLPAGARAELRSLLRARGANGF